MRFNFFTILVTSFYPHVLIMYGVGDMCVYEGLKDKQKGKVMPLLETGRC